MLYISTMVSTLVKFDQLPGCIRSGPVTDLGAEQRIFDFGDVNQIDMLVLTKR